jgi:cystathionine beta-lyase/cystathionine gamma-synthase
VDNTVLGPVFQRPFVHGADLVLYSATKFISVLAVSLGGTEALIAHPQSMTHSDMTIEDLERCGITEAMIRLSVGLESSDDVIQDLFQALDQA